MRWRWRKGVNCFAGGGEPWHVDGNRDAHGDGGDFPLLISFAKWLISSWRENPQNKLKV